MAKMHLLYYSNEARRSAIEEIRKLIQTVYAIPGNVLEYNDASAIARYLEKLADEIERESRTDEAKAMDTILNGVSKFLNDKEEI